MKAAVEAREDPNTLIVARTDALAVTGFEDALERAKRYQEAGADVLFVEAPTGPEQMTEICQRLSVPCLANMVEGGKTPLLPNTQLQEIGYRVVIYPNLVTRVMARHVQNALASLREYGTSQQLLPELMLFPELNALLGIEELNAMEKRYAVDERTENL